MTATVDMTDRREPGGYGWIPDLPDQRDHLFTVPAATLSRLPSKVDLREKCPPVYDQGPLGSCTAQAIAAAYQFELGDAGKPDMMPSRLFIYYNERVMLGTVDTDSGAMIRDGFRSVAKQGACPESMWTYTVNRFTWQPSTECYETGEQHRLRRYARVQRSPRQFKGCLAHGRPFVFGFAVYDSFESAEVARTGEAPMPAMGEELLGGHAVLAVGYDDASQRFLCRNSWGATWGMDGYFTLPYAYLTDHGLASDFWTIYTVTDPALSEPS